MFQTWSTKSLVLITVFQLVLNLVFAFIATGGGMWTVSTSDAQEGGGPSLGTVVFHFGLSQYRLTVQGNFVYSVDYSETLDKLNLSPQYRMDFEDALSGGRTTSAFLGLGIVFLIASLVFHLFMWPMDKYPFLHRYALWTVALSEFCFLLAAIMWVTLGHNAVEHISVDQYNAPFQLSYGWCRDLMVAVIVLLIPATFFSFHSSKSAAAGPQDWNVGPQTDTPVVATYQTDL